MTLADFEITVHSDPPRAVRVLVYDNLKGLRIAASRYDNATRSRGRRLRGDHADTTGICHRFEHYASDGTLKPLCAIVRLAHPHVGIGVVSHELAHAAVWINELDRGGPTLPTDDDEEFCWTLGELVRQTGNILIDRGIWA